MFCDKGGSVVRNMDDQKYQCALQHGVPKHMPAHCDPLAAKTALGGERPWCSADQKTRQVSRMGWFSKRGWSGGYALRVLYLLFNLVEVQVLVDRGTSSQHPLSIRIDKSTGATDADAEVIGENKFLYDLWGEVLNTVSRMASHAAAGRIRRVNATRQDLIKPFLFEHGGVIEIKGKVEMSAWFLNKLHSFDLAGEGKITRFQWLPAIALGDLLYNMKW